MRWSRAVASVRSKGAKELVDSGPQNKHKIKVTDRFHVTLMLKAGASPAPTSSGNWSGFEILV